MGKVSYNYCGIKYKKYEFMYDIHICDLCYQDDWYDSDMEQDSSTNSDYESENGMYENNYAEEDQSFYIEKFKNNYFELKRFKNQKIKRNQHKRDALKTRCSHVTFSPSASRPETSNVKIIKNQQIANERERKRSKVLRRATIYDLDHGRVFRKLRLGV
jgi:hypothetical protein